MPSNKSSDYKTAKKLFLLIVILGLHYVAVERLYGVLFSRLSQRSYDEMMALPPADTCRIQVFVCHEEPGSTEYYPMDDPEDRASLIDALSHLEYNGYYGGKNPFPQDLGTYYSVSLYCENGTQRYSHDFYLGRYSYGYREDFFLRSYAAKFSNTQPVVDYLDAFVARAS